ncbi:unnamed protein product [Protopolystoma xenopodis]|uniref:Uncharacterized protein n=1 Tax=Protopolystoma xenopodis TaxID=117903 RepID=A0A448XJE9_9PLAT|nr:unnamed protein product [Protopolystoma xenopodis]
MRTIQKGRANQRLGEAETTLASVAHTHLNGNKFRHCAAKSSGIYPSLTPECSVQLAAELGLPPYLSQMFHQNTSLLLPISGCLAYNRYAERMKVILVAALNHLININPIPPNDIAAFREFSINATNLSRQIVLCLQQVYCPRFKIVVHTFVLDTATVPETQMVIGSRGLWTPSLGDDYFTIQLQQPKFECIIAVFGLFVE